MSTSTAIDGGGSMSIELREVGPYVADRRADVHEYRGPVSNVPVRGEIAPPRREIEPGA